jgi:hypothetical protein
MVGTKPKEADICIGVMMPFSFNSISQLLSIFIGKFLFFASSFMSCIISCNLDLLFG